MPPRRLKSLSDVRRYLADLIRRTEAGEIDPSVSGRLGYLANILLGAIKDSDLEVRLAALERQLQNKGVRK